MKIELLIANNDSGSGGGKNSMTPVGEISSNSFSNFKERAVQWTVATIKFAEQELNTMNNEQ